MANENYDIVMAAPAWDYFAQMTDLVSTEVAGFGYCDIVEPEDESAFLFVDEVFAVPQLVSGGEVDFDTEGLPFALDKSIKDGKVDKLRFCIHSHVNMQAAFSNTDDEMIEKMGSTGTPWFASVIFNKSGDTAARVDVFKSEVLPGMGHITLPARVYRDSDAAIIDACRADIKQFIKKAPPPPKKKVNNVHTYKGNQPAQQFTKQVGFTGELTKVGEVEHAFKQVQANKWSYFETTNGEVYFYDEKMDRFAGYAGAQLIDHVYAKWAAEEAQRNG